MWVNLTQLPCRRKSEPSGLSSVSSPLTELTNLQIWKSSGYAQSRSNLVLVIDAQCATCFWCLFPTVFKTDTGERREGSTGQSPGPTTDQCKWCHTRKRGLEGQRCGEDTGGTACQGEGQKSTLSKQAVPGAATPNRAGEHFMLLKEYNRKKHSLSHTLLEYTNILSASWNIIIQ